METLEERKKFLEELKMQWKTLWRERIDDKVRAEGISDKDYSQLFVERGTVIMATRKFKPPDFYEILQQHFSSNSSVINNLRPPNPTIGGWGKFAQNVWNKRQRRAKRRLDTPKEPKRKSSRQLKKGGRGWLHFKR